MRKNNIFKITGIVLAITSVLAGCSSGTTQTSTADSSQSAGSEGGTEKLTGQTLSVMLSEEPGAEDALGNALDSWASESGNTIKKIIISHDDMRSKFPAMAKNKDLPDIISTTGLHQLYPDEFVNMAEVVDLSKFNPEAVKIVGKSYTSEDIVGVPEQFTSTCIYYNKDAFTAAGLSAPTAENPWTWDELYENAKTLQDAGIKYGFAADVSRARYDVLMYANGGSLTEKDGDGYKIVLNSPQNVETLTKFVAANDSGVMPKAIWAGGTTDNPVEYFKNGDAAIFLSGSWNYNTFFNDISKFEFGVMTSPKGSESQAAIIGGAALAIPKNAKNAELAKQFVQWLYNDSEHYQNYLQLHKGLSVMNDVSYKPESEKATEDFEIMQNELNYVTDTYMVDEASSWRVYKNNEYRDALKRAVAGEVTPQEALDNFAKELSESSGWSIAQ